MRPRGRSRANTETGTTRAATGGSRKVEARVGQLASPNTTTRTLEDEPAAAQHGDPLERLRDETACRG